MFFVIAAIVLAADQISKLLIRLNLAPGESVPREGFFRFTYVQNTGAVFGLSVDENIIVIVTALVILCTLVLYYRLRSSGVGITRLALWLLASGAVGNLIDRLWLGYVTDFIDIRLWHDYHWPAFNLADSAIVIGTGILAYALISATLEGRRSASAS